MGPIFQYGDIVGVQSDSFLSWMAEKIFSPSTRLYHFLIIAGPVPEDDYVILESIDKGVTVGRLSWYRNEIYFVFRIKQPEARELGEKAYLMASNFGRHHYDYLLYIKMLIGVGRCFWGQIIKEHRIRRIRPAELPYTRNNAFICTELANEVWRQVGYPIVPKGITPLPASFVQAYNDGKLECIHINY